MKKKAWKVKFSPNRKYRDRLFRKIFENDRRALLELYNALNGTDYCDPMELQIITIQNVVYMSMKNDLAFVITGMLNLYEHQSTYNPNMPLRFLWYLAQQYQMIIRQRNENEYGSKLIKLPAPQCVVFYNGDKDLPDKQILRLTDAFGENADASCLELKVCMLNINYKHNEELMEKCQKLREYAFFVNEIKENLKCHLSLRKSIGMAIAACREEHVLEDFLTQSRAEVLGMLLTEYREKEYLRLFKRDAREEGLEEGWLEGVRILVETCREMGLSKEETVAKVRQKFSGWNEEKEKKLLMLWQSTVTESSKVKQ